MVGLSSGYIVRSLLQHVVFYYLFLHQQWTPPGLYEKCLCSRCHDHGKSWTSGNYPSTIKYKIVHYIKYINSKAFLAYVTAHFTWKRLLNVSGKHIYRDDYEDSTYNRICSDSLDESITNYVRVITLQMISLSIVMIVLLRGLLSGQRITVFGVRLSFFNEYPELEYFICVCWESVNGIIGLIGIMTIEIKISLINDTISVASALCEAELDQINAQFNVTFSTQCDWHSEFQLTQRVLMSLQGFEA